MPIDRIKSILTGLLFALGTVLIVTFIASKVFAADKGGEGIFADAPLAPSKSWTGIYLGANVGYGIAVVDLPGTTELAFKDWTFGISAGADAQVGKSWVLGAFADYDVLKSGDFDKGIWTVGARAGYLLSHNAMLYALGGYAQSIDVSDLNAMVLGGGLEYRLSSSWSTKLEYRHFFVNEDVAPNLDVHHVRFGLNYKF